MPGTNNEVTNTDNLPPLRGSTAALRHASGPDVQTEHNDNVLDPRQERNLLLETCVLVTVVVALNTTQPAQGLPRISVTLTFTDAGGLSIFVDAVVNIEIDGRIAPFVGIEGSMFNKNGTSLCEGCSLAVQAGDCLADCDSFDKDAVNKELVDREGIDYEYEVHWLWHGFCALCR